MLRQLLFRYSLSFSIGLMLVGSSYGGIISFDFFGADFSGGGATLNHRVAVITIDDSAAGLDPNEVRVTLTLDPDNFYSGTSVSGIGQLYLNLVDGLDNSVDNLVITAPNTPMANTTLPGSPYSSHDFGTDDNKADGKDYFDIFIKFDQADFDLGVSSVFDLRLTSGGVLDSSSFLADSEKKQGGVGDFPMFAAIHLNQTGNDQSGFYEGHESSLHAVPEPGSIIVWTSLVIVLAGRRRRS